MAVATSIADRAAAFALPPREASWNADDVILYHLGIGAGTPSTDPSELAYVYERNLKVLPSFAVIPASRSLMDVLTSPELGIDLPKLLHGEQELELDGPLPPTAEGATTTARITEVFDKGKAALVVLETETSDADGTRLFLNRFRLFVRDAGGFGGDPGPSTSRDAPTREPDIEVERKIEDRQALLYRLSGDKNPLHADPEFARRGGFDRPILHGLCTYGIACKAAVDEALDGDVSRVSSYAVRFAGVVYPGETLVVQLWREPDRIALSAFAKERQAPVLTHAELEIRRDEA